MESNNGFVQKKICMLGSFAIGKTSLVRRFLYNLFDERYLNTIGVSISRKEVPLPGDRLMRLLIWDLSASDRFKKNRYDYLHGSSGALLVCDLTRPETITDLQENYVKHLHEINPEAVTVVVGNKLDLVKPGLEAISQVMRVAGEIGAPYQITSAKTGEGVETAFQLLAEGLYAAQ